MDAVLPADPATLLTPLLWDKAQVQELLRGSPVAEEALQRRAAIDEEWQALQAQAPALLPPGTHMDVVVHVLWYVLTMCTELLPPGTQR